MNNNKKLYVFLILLPIIDLITSLTTRFMNTTLSIGVIIKLIFLTIMLITLLFSTSKYKKKSIAYVILIFIYMIAYILSKIKYLTLTLLLRECIYLFKIAYFAILFVCLLCYLDMHKLNYICNTSNITIYNKYWI